eukprot:TRINITY_DN4322_c1_g1_i2.p1 TRINITY_DN4322_c1_g1~~TRINITY_DN4322_c1_g1_i2.p1  ORF type:complete len:466 (+),score=103.92 TRINITY_DN4322_c1_g1_i2:106-1398(+)
MAAAVLLMAMAGADAFGHAMLKEFTFPEGWTNLNQGSYGAIPSAVAKARNQYQSQMDANPEVFFRVNMTGDGRTVYSDLVDRARTALAGYLSARTLDLVIVENASHGINAVLRSLAKFLQGKAALYLDTAYGMVKGTLQYLAGEREGVPSSPDLRTPIHEVPIKDLMPGLTRAGIVERVSQALASESGEIGLCCFSHITSTPGLILPAKQLIEACHARGALVLIDGAHAPGHIPVNLTDLGADFYVGNGHKWLFSPKGSAFLHVKESAQKYVQPLVIDQGPGKSLFTQSFKWQGTEDTSAFAAIKDALDWRAALGDSAIMKYMTETAAEGGDKLAALWGTEQLPTDATERAAMQGVLSNVRVPCGFSGEVECPADLAARVVRTAGTFVPVGEFAGPGRGVWARVSASVYVEPSDFVMYGNAVLRELRKQE